MITEEQKQRRINGIFSTDAVKIMTGKSAEVAAEKLGLGESKDISDLWNVKLGNVMEPYILEAYERIKGVKLIHSPDTIYHKEYDWFGVHLDGLDELNNEVVEAKAFNKFFMYKFGDEQTDEIPIHRIWQSLTQIAITNCNRVHIPIFTVSEKSLAEFICDKKISDESLSFYVVENDNNAKIVINDIMLPKLKKVRECIISNDLDSLCEIDDEENKLSQSASTLYKKANEGMIESTEKINNILNSLAEAKEEEKSITLVKEGLQESVKRYMKNKECLVSGDLTLATWKLAKDGSRRLLIK